MGADSHWSSPLPWGTPSITSTRTTRRASSLSARRWAAVAPTFPALTSVLLFSMTIVVGEVRASYTEPLGLGSTLCGQAVIGVGSGIAPSPQRGVLRAAPTRRADRLPRLDSPAPRAALSPNGQDGGPRALGSRRAAQRPRGRSTVSDPHCRNRSLGSSRAAPRRSRPRRSYPGESAGRQSLARVRSAQVPEERPPTPVGAGGAMPRGRLPAPRHQAPPGANQRFVSAAAAPGGGRRSGGRPTCTRRFRVQPVGARRRRATPLLAPAGLRSRTTPRTPAPCGSSGCRAAPCREATWRRCTGAPFPRAGSGIPRILPRLLGRRVAALRVRAI